MQDASVVLIALGFTCMAVSSALGLPVKARLAGCAAGAVLVLLSLAVPVRLPVSRTFGDALDIAALLILALTTCWVLFSPRGARPEPEKGGEETVAGDSRQ